MSRECDLAFIGHGMVVTVCFFFCLVIYALGYIWLFHIHLVIKTLFDSDLSLFSSYQIRYSLHRKKDQLVLVFSICLFFIPTISFLFLTYRNVLLLSNSFLLSLMIQCAIRQTLQWAPYAHHSRYRNLCKQDIFCLG